MSTSANGASRYVETKAIREAVKGRELDVLRAIGIEWRGGRGHIRCPYEDHGGDDDWRWDGKRKLAFCTCIGRRSGERKAHNIFMVVAVKEGVDFEGSKLRVAEIIGRAELIETKHQRTDPDSLLNTPPENRDDSLVWNYLGHRLGIPPECVPRPATDTVGIRSLAYFDPPRTKRGKPIRVGDFSCAVFETVDRDGKRHAHRIYVAPGGIGKAELGINADGKARKSKKSAKAAEDESTAGRAVIWGDLSKAETEMIVEGVETAAAAALAFQTEIATGKIVIAACITAGGIEAFKPWPSAKRVIVAADRDENSENSRAPTRRGEIAARNFAKRHHREIAVSVALPGRPGEKVDWLDVLRHDGVEAVRGGIVAAVPYVPTPDELPSHASGYLTCYDARSDGLWFVDPDPDRANLHLCGPIEAVALTRDSEGRAWGVLLAWKDSDGRRHEWAMPRALLAGDGVEVRRELLDRGLFVAHGRSAREKLVTWLGVVQPEEIARCVARIGWHGDTYVLPDATFGLARDRVVLQADRTDHAFRTLGTLDDWSQNVAAPCIGNSRLIFATSAAFTPPLLYLTGTESGGVHLTGASSIGKTTVLVIGASVWGGGGVRGYIRQWRATDNGLESLAAMHCDALLPLDEISQVDPKAAGAAAYMLANGTGKNRSGRFGERRAPAEWRIIFLSTGEIGLADKVAEDGRGRRVTAGQQVRVVDVPADAGAGYGVFENLHDSSSGDAFARRLRDAAARCYGTAARAFLDEIARDREGISATVTGFRDEFVSDICHKGVDGQVKRVAERFGLIAAAGELAIALAITPWPVGEAKNAAKTCFEAWLATRGDTGPAEITAGIAKVRGFIEAHGEGRFAAWEESGGPHTVINRAGFHRRAVDGGIEYLIFPAAWQEISAGFNSSAIANALAERGILIKDKDGKLQSRNRNPDTKKVTRFYVIKGTILGDEEDDAAAEAAA